MKLFTKFKGVSRKTLLLSTITAVVLGIGAFHLSSAQAQNINIGGARDCDSNAVVYCGAGSVNQFIHKYNNGDGLNRSGGIKNIFNHFGINQSEVQNMNKSSTHVERGKVSKSGDVYDANGKLIATNAITAGREYMPGSTKVTRNGTTFYTRPSSASFLSNTLDAYIVKVNGQFSFAILAACGNPVKAKPTTPPKPQPKPEPNYDVVKEVKVKGTNNFTHYVKVKSGTHVIYSVTVRSTGKAAAKNVVVRDQLPAHVRYVDGTLKRDGKVLTGQANRFFSNGIVAEHIAPGTVKHYTFEAIVGPNDKPENCKNDKLTNVARIKAPGLPEKGSNAVVHKSCKPKPPVPKPQSFSCESLRGVAGSRVSYSFVARADTANGAKIKSYQFNFGDGQSTTVNSNALKATTAHTYPNLDEAKTYTATVTVTAIVDGQTVTKTAPACSTPVYIAPRPPQPPEPSAECVSLNLTIGANRSITAQTTVATEGNVQLTSISYDFDDGTTLLVNSLNPVSHTYAADGEYLVKAAVTFTVAGQNVTSNCQAPVSFEAPTPPEPCVDNPETTEDECNPVTPEIPVTTTPSGSEGVSELSKTGPASTAAMFLAVTVLSTLGYRSLLRRRLGQQ